MMEKSLKNYVVGLLRSASRKWGPKNDAFKLARIERGLYKCAMCGEAFKREQVVADHIYPVVDPRTGWTNFDDFIERLFCEATGYQILCENCHSAKTMLEDEIRKQKTKERNEEKKRIEKEQKKLDKLNKKRDNKKKKEENGTTTPTSENQ